MQRMRRQLLDWTMVDDDWTIYLWGSSRGTMNDIEILARCWTTGRCFVPTFSLIYIIYSCFSKKYKNHRPIVQTPCKILRSHRKLLDDGIVQSRPHRPLIVQKSEMPVTHSIPRCNASNHLCQDKAKTPPTPNEMFDKQEIEAVQ